MNSLHGVSCCPTRTQEVIALYKEQGWHHIATIDSVAYRGHIGSYGTGEYRDEVFVTTVVFCKRPVLSSALANRVKSYFEMEWGIPAAISQKLVDLGIHPADLVGGGRKASAVLTACNVGKFFLTDADIEVVLNAAKAVCNGATA